MTRRKKRETNLKARILSVMRRGGKRRYIRPWSFAELHDRVTGNQDHVRAALEALVREGWVRMSDGLPRVYYLEP